MQHAPARPAAGFGGSEVDRGRDRIAATDRLLERPRERVTAAMAQGRLVDGPLRPGAQRSVARPPAGAGAEHVTEVLYDELAAHLRAVRLHERAARLQEGPPS